MQIVVTIPDGLAAQVEAAGLSPQAYVEQLIAAQVASPGASVPPNDSRAEDYAASLDTLAQYSDKIPSLPIEALSRSSIYQDHD